MSAHYIEHNTLQKYMKGKRTKLLVSNSKHSILNYSNPSILQLPFRKSMNVSHVLTWFITFAIKDSSALKTQLQKKQTFFKSILCNNTVYNISLLSNCMKLLMYIAYNLTHLTRPWHCCRYSCTKMNNLHFMLETSALTCRLTDLLHIAGQCIRIL